MDLDSERVSYAKREAIEDESRARVNEIKELGGVEVTCIVEMYETEGKAKREKVEVESKACLKELKLTRDLERKCIAEMYETEGKAKREKVEAESKASLKELKLTRDLRESVLVICGRRKRILELNVYGLRAS
jgi:hypothetical protein